MCLSRPVGKIEPRSRRPNQAGTQTKTALADCLGASEAGSILPAGRAKGDGTVCIRIAYFATRTVRQEVHMENWIEAGKIINTHGLRGELKVEPWCDTPDWLCQFSEVKLRGEVRKITSKRVHKRHVLLVLDGIDNATAAQALRDEIIYIDRTGVTLPEGRYFVQDLIGLSVFDADGIRVGTLFEVNSSPAHDIYHVKGDDGDHYIPAVPAFIKDIDVNVGIMRVELIEGM